MSVFSDTVIIGSIFSGSSVCSDCVSEGGSEASVITGSFSAANVGGSSECSVGLSTICAVTGNALFSASQQYPSGHAFNPAQQSNGGRFWFAS